jgi:hypothetical protein
LCVQGHAEHPLADVASNEGSFCKDTLSSTLLLLLLFLLLLLLLSVIQYNRKEKEEEEEKEGGEPKLYRTAYDEMVAASSEIQTTDQTIASVKAALGLVEEMRLNIDGRVLVEKDLIAVSCLVVS